MMTARRARWAWPRPAPLAAGLMFAGTLMVADGRAQSLEKHDTSLPIEITADSLEVLQDRKIATFAGNVDAVQGDMVLRADQLRVHYGDDGTSAPGGPPGMGSIRRIEAEGNVLLSSPRETAQGEIGVYDVPANQLTMEGSVVLTQDDNVIRGQRLEIDLVSGRSRVLAAVPSTEGGTAPQRVRALFTPEGSAEPSAGPTDQPAPAAEAGAK
jgi:lipopolysaccharide export system protein LptA